MVAVAVVANCECGHDEIGHGADGCAVPICPCTAFDTPRREWPSELTFNYGCRAESLCDGCQSGEVERFIEEVVRHYLECGGDGNWTRALWCHHVRAAAHSVYRAASSRRGWAW